MGVGQQFTIVANDAADANSGTFSGLGEGASINAGGYRFTISYVGGTGNDVVLTLVGVPGAAVASAVTAGNGSHAIVPNECNNLSLVISNQSAATMTGVSATLSAADSQVLVTQPYSGYPDVPASGVRTNTAAFQVSTLPTFPCGNDINLTLTVSSASHGSFSMPVVLHTGGPGTVTNRYDISGNVAIPDPGTVESTNTVGGFAGTVAKVAVSVYLTHSYISDLSLWLIAPDGTTVPLTLNNGGGGANYGANCSPDESRTTFDDAAATSITAGTAPFMGTYRPQGSLASLVNTTANGNWRLRITDGFGGTAGTLRCWSLFLYPTTCATGNGYCDTCPGIYPGAITAGDTIMTNRLYRTGNASTCDVPTSCPGAYSTIANYRYDTYAFTNLGPDTCVTVALDSACGADLDVSAYLGSSVPGDPCANYLGALGNGPTFDFYSFSVSVPAGARFEVVVNETSAGSGCASYNLIVSGLPCPPPPLAIAPAGIPNNARIHWPTWAGGYGLEAKSSLTTGSWGGVTNEPTVNGGRYNVTNSTANPSSQIYRLHKP